jgi:hypothetical protein
VIGVQILARTLTRRAIFESAAAGVVDALNEQAAARGTQIDDRSATMRGVLARFNEARSRINSSWPAESRFRADVLTVSPLLLMKASFRNRWALYTFGVGAEPTGERKADLVQDWNATTA